MIDVSRVIGMCTQPAASPEDGARMAMHLSHGGYQVLLHAPHRAGDVWRFAVVRSRDGLYQIGHLTYRVPERPDIA